MTHWWTPTTCQPSSVSPEHPQHRVSQVYLPTSLTCQSLTHCSLVMLYGIPELRSQLLQVIAYAAPSHYLTLSLVTKGPIVDKSALGDPMLTYPQLDHLWLNSMKSESKYIYFLSRKGIWICCMQMVATWLGPQSVKDTTWDLALIRHGEVHIALKFVKLNKAYQDLTLA